MSDDAPEDLNLTPYLDVLMNLIVFVLVSGAGVLTWGVLPATTPAASCADCDAARAVPRLRLERGRATLSLAGEEPVEVTLDQLPERLGTANGHALVLAADRDVTLDRVVGAMDAARKAHFDEVTLAD